jgi:thioredoxin reductase
MILIDILILAGGSSGLTAAISIARNEHKAIIFDLEHSQNERGEYFYMLPTWVRKNPYAFWDSARENTLWNHGTISFRDDKTTSVKKNEDGFLFPTTSRETSGTVPRAWSWRLQPWTSFMYDIPG